MKKIITALALVAVGATAALAGPIEDRQAIMKQMAGPMKIAVGISRDTASYDAAAAKKAMVRVPLRDGRTLHHDGYGHFGAGKVYVRSATQGTGIIAGGPMRAVFESLGVADVVTKSVGTNNPYNMIRATFAALVGQVSPKSVAQRRGKKVVDLLSRRGDTSAKLAEADAEAVA